MSARIIRNTLSLLTTEGRARAQKKRAAKENEKLKKQTLATAARNKAHSLERREEFENIKAAEVKRRANAVLETEEERRIREEEEEKKEAAYNAMENPLKHTNTPRTTTGFGNGKGGRSKQSRRKKSRSKKNSNKKSKSRRNR
jgi:hypothetical protein